VGKEAAARINRKQAITWNMFWKQALDIIETQEIDVLYTTPPVLDALALRMSAQKRMAIKGVHYGGISIGKDAYKRFKEETFRKQFIFPDTVILFLAYAWKWKSHLYTIWITFRLGQE
jgi:hypothetical protein